MKKICLEDNFLMKLRPRSNQSVKYYKFGAQIEIMSRKNSFLMDFPKKKMENNVEEKNREKEMKWFEE